MQEALADALANNMVPTDYMYHSTASPELPVH